MRSQYSSVAKRKESCITTSNSSLICTDNISTRLRTANLVLKPCANMLKQGERAGAYRAIPVMCFCIILNEPASRNLSYIFTRTFLVWWTFAPAAKSRCMHSPRPPTTAKNRAVCPSKCGDGPCKATAGGVGEVITEENHL
jgi:hypothetical protein